MVEAFLTWPCPAPSSFWTSQPQEQGHAGLVRPQTPNMIERLATKLRGGNIHIRCHSRGRVQWLADGANLLPGPFGPASPHLPVLGPVTSSRPRTYRVRSATSRSIDTPTIKENRPGKQNYLGFFETISDSFDLPG